MYNTYDIIIIKKLNHNMANLTKKDSTDKSISRRMISKI